MKAKEIAELLMLNPEAEVRVNFPNMEIDQREVYPVRKVRSAMAVVKSKPVLDYLEIVV